MGALKAPKVSKIERIVCWCHFTRLPKLDKVSYFKIFKVIKNKAEKTPFLFRIAPPHPIQYILFSPGNTKFAWKVLETVRISLWYVIIIEFHS